MGGGASNISKSSLDVFQQAITQVGQDIRSSTSNDAQQIVKFNQKIIFNNEKLF